MDTHTPPKSTRQELFRREAVEYNIHKDSEHGPLLRVFPSWTRWTYRFIALSVLVTLAYVSIATIHEYAMGPAIIWFKGRQEVTTRKPGTVKAINVYPGQKVRAGDVLVRLHDAQESANFTSLQQEFETQLVSFLADPRNDSARQSLSMLRAQRDKAAALLEEQTVKAPYAGTVTDLNVRLGQRVAEGDTLASLVHTTTACSALAMLPGHYRPQLRPGMKLRMEIRGYRFAYQNFVIDAVADQIVGPGEVQRYVGLELKDAVMPEGPTVLVWTHPTTPSFTIDGRTYSYYHGMVGRAEVPVLEEHIIMAIVPALRLLF